MIRRIINRLICLIVFVRVYSAGKILGISSVVRYLRNPNPRVSVRLLRAFGARIGRRTTIKRSLFLDNVWEDENSAGDFSNISIGENCYIGDGVYFDLANKILVEDDVVVSGQVSCSIS